MVNRQRGTSHFTIRHTRNTPPRRRLGIWVVLPLALGLFIFNRQVTPPAHSDTSPTQSQAALQSIVDSICSGGWGLETLDRASLLADSLAEENESTEEQAAVAYLRILVAGTPSQDVPDELLQDLGIYLGAADRRSSVPPQTLAFYRQALDAAYSVIRPASG